MSQAENVFGNFDDEDVEIVDNPFILKRREDSKFLFERFSEPIRYVDIEELKEFQETRPKIIDKIINVELSKAEKNKFLASVHGAGNKIRDFIVQELLPQTIAIQQAYTQSADAASSLLGAKYLEEDLELGEIKSLFGDAINIKFIKFLSTHLNLDKEQANLLLSYYSTRKGAPSNNMASLMKQLIKETRPQSKIAVKAKDER